jgi:hypothetical protein
MCFNAANDGCWYDTNYFSVLPAMMERYGTLGLFNQQAVEGGMRLRRADLKARATGQRAGRRSEWVHQLGEAGRKLDNELRDARADTTIQWTQKQTMWDFRSHDVHKSRFDLVEDLMDAPNTPRVPDVEQFREHWKLDSAAVRATCPWVGRSRLRWAGEAGDDHYTRLAAAVNSHAATSPPDAAVQLPERGKKTATLYAKQMDVAMSTRWKQAGGEQLYGEHWVRDKSKPLKATGGLLEMALQARERGCI